MRPALILATAILAFTAVADAQTPSGPAIKRSILQRFDLGTDREVVTAIAEIPPGMAAGRHTQGLCFGATAHLTRVPERALKRYREIHLTFPDRPLGKVRAPARPPQKGVRREPKYA